MKHAQSLLLAIFVTGCSGAADTGFPSLLPRPIEKRGFAEPERPVPVATPDAALDAEIGRKRTALAQAATTFDTGAGAAERLAAQAGRSAPGTEAWIAAQVALADLDTLRSGTAGLLADIEQMAIDRAADGKPVYPALEALQEMAKAQNQREIDRIARIQSSMPAA